MRAVKLPACAAKSSTGMHFLEGDPAVDAGEGEGGGTKRDWKGVPCPSSDPSTACCTLLVLTGAGLGSS